MGSPVAPPRKYTDALRTHAIQLYRESDPTPTSRRMAADLGVHHEALRLWIRHAEHMEGRAGNAIGATEESLFTAMAKENKKLRRRVADLERIIAVLRTTRPLASMEFGRILP
ncbi:transposase [Streptomyces sp. NPDC059083]|uniref:transposase n=1 Tax=Streptomyces sp. NPDC059083 TaxID=3346721 RepID=UPI0036A3AFF6